MIGDQDYSWMNGPAIKAPVPYSVRRRRTLHIFLSLCVIAVGIGVLVALAKQYA